jgi:hypothetical protein
MLHGKRYHHLGNEYEELEKKLKSGKHLLQKLSRYNASLVMLNHISLIKAYYYYQHNISLHLNITQSLLKTVSTLL